MNDDHHSMTIASADGVRLAATRLGWHAAAATVVYVHGLLTDSSYWHPATACLHERMHGGIAQITYDQRGHGNSGRPDRRARTTMDHLVDDLDTVLARATGAVVLAAHSAGALVVHAWAERYPGHAATLAGMVFFNSPGEFPEFPTLPTHFRHVPRWLHRCRNTALLDAVAATAAAATERRFRRHSQRLGAKAHLVTADRAADPRVVTDVLAAYRGYVLTAGAAARLRGTPSFVVAGDRDRIVPPTQSARLADKLWADYETVPRAGHSLPHTQPEIVADTITRALEIAYRATTGPTRALHLDDETGRGTA
ncbi:pimeloyl-ACP methyl ester carboxylesterase [Nocardia transvalensis]|uniref:Pimeloyl-ACP methyl ester carboxylesterase n=1 Tax=Nocardia transvalensis TaxID=37333 RepID=A0A7W9PJR3_9NOCA|nr:alpha/beta hydrolase [Nocardia transvalensis]MBB5916874.1 pimeloyl-ACP methyl ester carboxylesterase [Nocardia transvalensis]